MEKEILDKSKKKERQINKNNDIKEKIELKKGKEINNKNRDKDIENLGNLNDSFRIKIKKI